MIPTFMTALALGTITAMTPVIMALSTWVAGSQILQGNLFFDTTTNPNPGIFVNTVKVMAFTGSTTAPSALSFDSTNSQPGCVKYGNNFIDCYQEAVFTSTGGCVAGGCATKSYSVASVTKPFSGSGSVKKIITSCDRQGKAATIDVDQVSATTASGAGFMNNVSIGSGSLAGYGSGGGILWREDKPIIKVSASSTVGPHQACLLQVWSSGTYDPA